MRSRPSLVRRVLHLLVAAVVGVCTLWTFVTPAGAAAGRSTFTGIAVWGNNDGNVAFATATLDRSGSAPLTTTADQSGNFSFAGVPDGTWRLQVSSPCGTQPAIVVTLPADPLVVRMTPQHDAFGYRCRTSIFGTPPPGTALALTGDDATASVALPFPFPFYGQQVSAITVSTNGWISASTGGSAPTNTGLPSAGHPDLAVYGFWDDLVVDGSATVRTKLTTNGSSHLFDIQWLDVALKSDPAQRLNVYVRLNDFNDSVIVWHQAVSEANPAERGAGATVGIEGPAGITSLEVSHDEAVAVSGRAYIFLPEPTPPSADAGADQAVPSEGSLILDASASSDADGGPLAISWVQTTGPATALDDPSSARPRATAPRGPATLGYRVTVTDLSGLTDVDDVTITVGNPPSK